MGQLTTVVERFVIPHQAFADAHQQIEQAFEYAQDKSEAEGLAVIGQTGTGKTSVLNAVRSEHEPHRDQDGMKVPILYAKVPNTPTVKSLAGKLLAAMEDPEPDRGTANELTRRLHAHMKAAGTCMLMLDEFQHFYSRDKHKVMYDVADWLKVLIDETNSTLVVAGLPECMGVIDSNEQLVRRFQQRLELPRFSWTKVDERSQFMGILISFGEEISSKGYEIPPFSEESMAFRFYCATGGLIGYLSKLLKKMLRNANCKSRSSIILEDIAIAYKQSIWRNEECSELYQPFSRAFDLTQNDELWKNVARIGTKRDEPLLSSEVRKQKLRRPTINSMLRIR